MANLIRPFLSPTAILRGGKAALAGGLPNDADQALDAAGKPGAESGLRTHPVRTTPHRVPVRTGSRAESVARTYAIVIKCIR
jgi:hypothetical protein